MKTTKNPPQGAWIMALVFAVIIILIGFYLGGTKQSVAPLPNPPANTGGGQGVTAGQLFYTGLDGKSQAIFAYSMFERKSKKIFTDKDEDLKLKNVSSATNDGKNIFAVLGQAMQDFGGKLVEISTDGKGSITPLIDDFASPQAPVLSPDGQKILAVSFSNAEQSPDGVGFTLYVANRNGNNKRQIAQNPSGIFSAVWSDNAKKVAYFINDGQAGFKLMIADIDQPQVHEIKSFQGQVYSLSWRKNKLAFVMAKKGNKTANTAEIYLIDDDGGNLKQITKNNLSENYPVISPDGQKIAFMVTEYSGGTTKLGQAGEIKILVLSENQSQSEKIADGLTIIGWTNE